MCEGNNEKIVCNICGKEFDEGDYSFGVKHHEVFAGYASRHDEERYDFNICSNCYDVVLDKVLDLCTVSPLVDDDYMSHCVDIRAHIHTIWGPGRPVCAYRIQRVEDIPDADYKNMICYLINDGSCHSIEYITKEGKYVGILGVHSISDEDIDAFIRKFSSCNPGKGLEKKIINDGFVLYYLSELKSWFESLDGKNAEVKSFSIPLHDVLDPSSCLQEFSLGLENDFKIIEG